VKLAIESLGLYIALGRMFFGVTHGIPIRILNTTGAFCVGLHHGPLTVIARLNNELVMLRHDSSCIGLKASYASPVTGAGR
jgi:hypothetical protein